MVISSDGTGLLLLSCVAGSVPLGGVLTGLAGPGGPKAADAGVVDLLHSGLGTGRSRSAWLVWFARRRTKLAFWRMLSLSRYGSKWLSVNEHSLTRCTTHTVFTTSLFVSVRPKSFVYRDIMLIHNPNGAKSSFDERNCSLQKFGKLEKQIRGTRSLQKNLFARIFCFT